MPPYVYAPLKTHLLPTIDETKKALKMATSETKPDPRALLSILARLPEADTRLLGIMQTRILAVTGYPFDVLPSDPENAKAVEIALAVKNRMKASGVHHRFGALLGAVFFGHGGIKCEWQAADGNQWVPIVSVVPSTTLTYSGGNVVLIKEASTFTTAPLEPREQYVITYFNPFESAQPQYVGGLFRTCMWLVLIKHFNWTDWAKFNELFVQPYRWATWAAGATEEEKAIAKQAVEQIGSDAWAAVSENVKLNFIEAVRTGSIEAYKKLLDSVNDELSILVLGQTLTTEVADKGSYAAAKVHNLVRADIMWHDLQMIERAVNEQYIATDFRLNHGDDLSLRPVFAFHTDDTTDTEVEARVVSELKAVGLPMKKSEVYKRVGYTEPAAGDETI